MQRVKLNYNAEGRFFSSEEGIVYHMQTKEVFAVLVLFGVIITGVLIVKIVSY